MDFKELKSFIKLAKDEGLSELKYETKDLKISLQFPVSGQLITTPMSSRIAVPSAVQSDIPMTSKSQSSAAVDTKMQEVKSPFVGTYYSASAPGEAPFVKVGDRISKGKVLCILEAMKIMNEIESEVSGTVVEVCLENESLVEYNQTLFKIRAD